MKSVTLEDDKYLSYLEVGDIHASPPVIFLPGIMGSKKNLLTFAQRFHEAMPTMSVIIVDLRNHGQSSKHWPPYTVQGAASDVSALVKVLSIKPYALFGHSFGGKVALLAAELITSIKQLWMLDCPIGALKKIHPLSTQASKTALQIIEILEELSWPIASRKDVVVQLQEHGVDQAIALWMTTNLHTVDNGLSLVFAPSELKNMLLDFMALDCWPCIATLSRRVAIHLVAAEYGGRLSEKDGDMLKAQAQPEQAFFHILPKSGHFLHQDNLAGLISIIAPFFQHIDKP